LATLLRNNEIFISPVEVKKSWKNAFTKHAGPLRRGTVVQREHRGASNTDNAFCSAPGCQACMCKVVTAAAQVNF